MYLPGTILMWTALLAGIASTITYWLSIKDPDADFLDVNGDNFVVPFDALLVINFLNENGFGEGEGEGTVLFEAANPRHEHEWRLWEEHRLPDGKRVVHHFLEAVDGVPGTELAMAGTVQDVTERKLGLFGAPMATLPAATAISSPTNRPAVAR